MPFRRCSIRHLRAEHPNQHTIITDPHSGLSLGRLDSLLTPLLLYHLITTYPTILNHRSLKVKRAVAIPRTTLRLSMSLVETRRPVRTGYQPDHLHAIQDRHCRQIPMSLSPRSSPLLLGKQSGSFYPFTCAINMS
jgi:hypothetical protein